MMIVNLFVHFTYVWIQFSIQSVKLISTNTHNLTSLSGYLIYISSSFARGAYAYVTD